MIKKLITSLMMLSDNGSLLKRPVKWLYSLMAFLSFVPVFVAIGVVINLWDELISLLGRGFWANFVSMFILDLALLALVLFGLVGYHFWKNRQKHLDSVIRAGSRNVAIPLVADINQSSGEINSLFLAIVPVTVAALAYLACLLTGGQEFYHDLNFLTWLLIIIAGAAALLLAAYLTLLLTRFVSERIRLLPFIGNDVQKIANGTPVSSEVNPSGSGSGFEFPKITRPEKLRVLGCVAGAAQAHAASQGEDTGLCAREI